MSLRSLLFTADEPSAQPIREALNALGVEGEYCRDAGEATEKLAHECFQIVILDWDQQPEAGQLLAAARERKLAERPLTLAIVSADAGVPKALSAGANSILRKPISPSQVQDTLKTARDLLRARQDAALQASAAAPASLPTSVMPGREPVLRAGEFLQSSSATATTQFDIQSDFQKDFDQSAAGQVDLLKELEPMAAAMPAPEVAPAAPLAPSPELDEPRGLEWYLKRKGVLAAPKAVTGTGAAAAAAPAKIPEKLELVGFDQNVSFTGASFTGASSSGAGASSTEVPNQAANSSEPEAERQVREQKAEAQLFAYIAGEDPAHPRRERRSFQLDRRLIIAAAVLAGCAITAAPQAPWHHRLASVFGRGQQAVHGWLNPQPVTPTQAPVSHENFGRPGDEYKLPVAETIPDATTDPSQIRVTPMVDPSAKKPNSAATADPNVDGGDETPNPGDGGQAPVIQVQENPPAPSVATTPGAAAPADAPAASAATTPSTPQATANAAPAPKPYVIIPPTPKIAAPRPPSSAPPSTTTAAIPSSLKSQMASMTPDASGNKPVEAALPSIEPVAVPEATERGLLTEQPAVSYPASAKGQQGTVVLQVLIGRDGAVQDAKFMQGSLAFARAAIDGVKQWKFKPYSLNGRPVSVQTQLTLSFKPGT